MLLSDHDLALAIKTGKLTIDPYDEESMLQPSSIDVRLDDRFRVFNADRHTHIDPLERQPGLTEMISVGPEGVFVLHPGEFVLGAVAELIGLDASLAGRVEGKSSLGRLGLEVHSTAGFIDPGFGGHVTLELSNVNRLPIKLYPGMKIGQLCVYRLSSPATLPYGHPSRESRYNGQRGPTESRYWQGRHNRPGGVDA